MKRAPVKIFWDTRENLSLRDLTAWQDRHPKLARQWEIKTVALPIGDVICDPYVIEIKIGSDLASSLNSKHLQNQLNRMLRLCKPRGLVPVLWVSEAQDEAIMARAATECSLRGILIKYNSTTMKMIDSLMDFIQYLPQHHFTLLDVKEGPKEEGGLVLGLYSSIPGLSLEFAAVLVGEHRTWESFLEWYTEAECARLAREHYGREMGELCHKITQQLLEE